MKKNLPLILLIGIALCLAGFLGYKVVYGDKAPQVPRQGNLPQALQKSDPRPANSLPNNQPTGEAQKTKTKSKVKDTDPKKGEIFVQGEVKAVDVEKRIITFEQQMDDNSVSIAPNVPIASDAVIQNQQHDISLGEVKVGDIVGMVVTKDRQARAVLVNF